MELTDDIEAWMDLHAVQREHIEAIWRAAERKSQEVEEQCGVKPIIGVFLTDHGEIVFTDAKPFITKTRKANIKLIDAPDQYRAPSTKTLYGVQIVTMHDDDL